ncbi:MAG: response regulator [Gammaproteobacteria bacterium]
MRSKSTPLAQVRRRILIIDHQSLVRRGLSALIESEPDLLVCAEAAAEQAGLEAVAASQPDLVIIDPLFASGDGLEMVKTIRLHHRALPILVLTTHSARRYVEGAWRAGASGYVTKRELGETLLDAIRRALDGEKYVSPKIRTALERG